MSWLGITSPIDIEKVPFPLLYEEIYLSSLKRKIVDEYRLKSFIAEKVNQIEPNEVHKRISTLGFSNILTTNYDHIIENALGFEHKDIDNKGKVKESLYSVFRHTQMNGTQIWHIHGEINSPNTILLGYEQYSGQLQHIRNYIVSGTGNIYKSFRSPSLFSLIKKGQVDSNSWLDLFFTQNIHIVGLTLDFIESDLWWLITYRARMKLEKKLPIKNSITYYYPGNFERGIQVKLEMFSANEILTEPISNEHDLSYYQKVFDYIEKNTR
jgi:hypothetical protein